MKSVVVVDSIKMVNETLRLRYSYARLQWLGLAITGLSIVTYSSQELWVTTLNNVSSLVNLPAFYVYVILFGLAIFIVNVKDLQNVCEQRKIIVISALISLILDLGVLYLSEFFVLLTINQVATNLIDIAIGISLIALPWSLGELTLTTLTVERLKERAEKLRREIAELKKEVGIIEEGRNEGERRLKELERKREELEKVFKKEKVGEKE